MTGRGSHPWGAALAVAAISLLLAACAPGPAEEDSERVVGRFQHALADGDLFEACDQLTDHLKDSLAREDGDTCPESLAELRLSGLGRPQRSRVFTTSAIVTVRGGGDAFLDETPSGWRISAAGCTRSGDRYDCRLED
ncbi:MAG: hypothetical protein JW895_05765 [Thermoleophilaceae bacterium]|nr:hypothetical protein [Thermoleophilaceae bacterium]